MRFEEVFFVEKRKEERAFLKFGCIFFSLMALVCLCLPNTPMGSVSQEAFVLLKCLMFLFWITLGIYCFISAGQQSLRIDFRRGTLSYHYGSPVTQQVHSGTLADISHLKLTRREGRNRTIHYLVHLHWRNKKLPKVLLEIDSSVESIRLTMREFADRCHTSCVDLDGSPGTGH